MFFNSFEFLFFFLVVLLLLVAERFAVRSVRLRNLTLLGASLFFYGYFNIGFLVLLWAVGSANWLAGRMLFRNGDATRCRWIVGSTVVASLLPLVYYKYAIFLISSLGALLGFEFDAATEWGIILPVGISFFTFQALSYPLDIYRGKIDRPADYLDFLLFVAFFPTILSGPIEKARNLLPQLRRYTDPQLGDVVRGASIFIWGLFKKVVVADRLANYVDWAYGSADYLSGTSLAVAAVFYSIQIYCDFSGYSDMALGVAKALGFDITKNFRQPYFSHTIKEFWRKWHIALTSWFTEYVYFSLGGSRVRLKARWVLNISTVFLLSGIWHGASWNFLIWGALHAVFYLAEHFSGLQSADIAWNRFTRLLGGIAVFLLVTLAWIFFRIESLGEALHVTGRIFTDFGSPLSMGASTFTFVATVAMLAVFAVYELAVRRQIINFDVAPAGSLRSLYAALPLLILIAMFGMSSDNFVYFQF